MFSFLAMRLLLNNQFDTVIMIKVMRVIGYPTKQNMNGVNTKGNIQGNTTLSHMGRGMSLESDINASNEFYLETDRALIHKKPTPVQIVRVDYPNRASAKIVEAYYKVPSTTDYNGIYRGRAIDFEAKETKNKVSFTFKAIHPHQIKHLEKVLIHGGIGFVLIRFTSFNETYLVDAKLMIKAYYDINSKSLSYQKIKEEGSLIREGLTPRLNYLDNVDEIYFSEEKHGKQ